MPRRRSPNIHERFREAVQRHQMGHLAEAREVYLGVLAEDPDHAGALHYLGTIGVQTGNPSEAIVRLERSIALAPDNPEALDHVGMAYRMAGELDRSAAAHRKALTLDPDNAAACSNLALTLLELGDPAGAEQASRKALELAADFPNALNNLALACREQGKLDEARACYRRALELAPDMLDAILGLAELKRWQIKDDELERLESTLRRPRVGSDNRRALHFALAQAYDQIGDVSRAFEHLRAGHALRKARFGTFDLPELRSRHRELKTLTAGFFAAHAGYGHSSLQPVFIVGMPRSGTTLVERVLATHPSVYAGGESRAVYELAREVLSAGGPLASVRLDRAWIAERSERILSELSPPDGSRPRKVTNKLPGNLENLWLIHVLFPNALIIACRRDPVDTCLSCYFRNFAFGHAYASDLETLGLYHEEVRSLMDHWRQVLPSKIIEARYETLVADADSEVPKLMAACGLELGTERQGLGSSAPYQRTLDARDRQRPAIDAESVGKWRRYRDHLGPLLAKLGREEGGIP